MDLKKYWEEKHIKYSQQVWIDKPSIFAKFAVKYFPDESRILELGAGQGQDSRFFDSLGNLVTSTDFSEDALKIAKSKTGNSTKISYQLLDLQNKFSLEDEIFDVVYAHMSIHYFDNKITKKIFSEIYRVLKVGGIAALLLNSVSDPEIENSEPISEDLFETPSGLIKRFFSEKSLEKFTSEKFETIILDSRGKTYKDQNKSLIRYIGKKI